LRRIWQFATEKARHAPRNGSWHHFFFDQGAHYSCVAYQRQLTVLGLTPSMSRKGNCYDHAVAESFFSTLKNELIHHQSYHTRDEASREIFAFIEGFYNRQRLHQSLGYLSPLAFERRVGAS
jgi:putative transposase